MLVQILDKSFFPDLSTSKGYISPLIKWDRVISNPNQPIVFTDLCLGLTKFYPNSRNIALIIEPAAINPSPYIFIEKNYHLFDLILTHHKGFCEINPDKVVWYPFGGLWLKEKDIL